MKPGILLILISSVLARDITPSDTELLLEQDRARVADRFYKGGIVATLTGVVLSAAPDNNYVSPVVTYTGYGVYGIGFSTLAWSVWRMARAAEFVRPGRTDPPEDPWEYFMYGWICHAAGLGLRAKEYSTLGALANLGGLGFHVASYFRFAAWRRGVHHTVWRKVYSLQPVPYLMEGGAGLRIHACLDN